ncbi:type II secretion system minor pseudopilin GspI [Sphingorhabdus profundilacus]|uniref:type II secretion system minor pseudopilin GspI n=1 Tax=Sphingorhabdus profundilacus TaxID=2509718 RepID=UPI0031B600AB
MSPVKSTLSRNGFTLLEIMVALAIFSLAALAMVRLQGYSVRSTANLGDSSMAWQVARNVAVEILSNPVSPTLGETGGEELNGGQNWRWTATASKTDDARLVRIEINVVGTGLAASRKARLSIARPVAQ